MEDGYNAIAKLFKFLVDSCEYRGNWFTSSGISLKLFGMRYYVTKDVNMYIRVLQEVVLNMSPSRYTQALIIRVFILFSFCPQVYLCPY